MAPAQQEIQGKRVLEQSLIFPAPGSHAPEILTLTFFDCIFLPFHPIQRVFFYDLPHSISHFNRNHLPKLKHSLSLALRTFRPLAGRLHLNSPDGSPKILCDPLDSVPFTIATLGDDFHEISGNRAKSCRRLHPLTPPLPPSSDGKQPVLALQATLFPYAGVALAITVSHAVADGSTSSHFLKTWAEFCRQGEKITTPPPSYDRRVVKDPKGLTSIFLRELKLRQEDGLVGWDVYGREDIVRATLTFSRENIKKLEERFYDVTGLVCSPYAAVSGVIWANLVKAKGRSAAKKEYFGFVTGCRARIKPPIPNTYFGNCLGLCRVEVDKEELVGDGGEIIASKAIWKVICNLEKEGPFGESENWVREIYEKASEGILTVAGSPKLGLYQVDFGWGRPRKIEIVSIERTSAISIAEWGDDGRGLEIGLALPRDLMGRFIALVDDGV